MLQDKLLSFFTTAVCLSFCRHLLYWELQSGEKGVIEMGKPKEQYRVLRALCEMCREGQHRFTTSLEGTQTGWELGISRYCPVDGQEPTGPTWIRVSDTVQPRLTQALRELAGGDLIGCYAMRGSAFVLHPARQGARRFAFTVRRFTL